ncbi:MAG: NapC/NirT family cytochrome c [Alphaproteobacteria bacterium]|nr:NapC/NirT family cytochrome c [Alphaproteobacteria bacterium]
MKHLLRLSGISLLTLGWLVLAPAPQAQAFMDCIECHADPNGGGFHGGFRSLTDMTRAEIDAVCLSCHDGSYTNPAGITAPEAAVHEQVYGGSGQRPEYGEFRAGCMDCHNPHGLLAGDGSLVENLQLLGAKVREASSTDGVGRIRKPIIGPGADGTPGTNDDVQTGWECDSGIPDDPTCDTSEDGFGGTHVRAPVFYGNIYEGGTWPSNGGVNPWANDTLPYNGACNSCHTRTSHHRRDNSGGDHTHNITKAGCVACHSHVSGWLNKGG